MASEQLMVPGMPCAGDGGRNFPRESAVGGWYQATFPQYGGFSLGLVLNIQKLWRNYTALAFLCECKIMF